MFDEVRIREIAYGRQAGNQVYVPYTYIFNQQDYRVYNFITNDLTYGFPFSEFEVPLNE